jgi:ribosomal protein S27E
MTGRYYLTVDCAYCGEENTVYYAPLDIETFDCKHCAGTNRVIFVPRTEGIDDQGQEGDK